MQKSCEELEQIKFRFYGVYLLCSQNPDKRFNGKCYIGFTVNPNRRIKQHNRGKEFGGAKKTSNKGPWKMILIVHGFPNNISALQFEWAWQQPSLSSRLKCFPELKRKLKKESYFEYNIRILSRMLNVGPWQRLPLSIRWLETKYECDFEIPYQPPKHMQIVSGNIAIESVKKTTKQLHSMPKAIWAVECHLCMKPIENVHQSRIGCLNSLCKLTCHIICLANHMLSSDTHANGHYIPIAGECPLCETSLLWIELLQRKRKMQGIALGHDFDQNDEESDDSVYLDDEIDDMDNQSVDSLENSMEKFEIYDISD